MIFVDTNYFLRFLLRDNENQYQDAKQLLLDGACGKVKLTSSTVVFFEVAWVLRSVYQKEKQALVLVLLKLLNLNIDFNDYEVLVASINLFAKNNLSLEDCYNITYAVENKVVGFKTFDKKLSKYYNSLVI
mgnify:CR=1 FL=1